MASRPPGTVLPAPEDTPPRRARELQDWLNHYVYHPLAFQLARLLRPTGITPNMVSVAGLLLIWGAAAAYAGLAWPLSFAIGLSLHLLWHVVDGADGDLARMTGRSSPTGELVDGVCDYAGHVLLYIVLAAMLDDAIGGWAWALAAAAGASRVVHTNHAESQRRHYLWWVYGIPWLKHAKAADDEVFKGGDWFSLTFGWMARDYLKLGNLMAPFAARIDAAVDEARGDPERRRRIAALVRDSYGQALVLEKLLGPNLRTLALGVSMAFDTPLYYFVTEAVLLNLLLAWSVRHHNAVGRELAARIG